MKNNIIQVIILTVVSGVIAGLVGLEVTTNVMTAVALGVSYLTVAALIAMTASNYRSNPKPYFASAIVSGHFQGSVPASVALSTAGTKARLAA